MSIYILRPKASIIKRFPDLASRKITAEKRDRQIQALAAEWQKDPVYQDVQHWLEDAQHQGVKPIAVNPDYLNLTGTTVAEMTAEQAEELHRDIPNLTILKDGPIELIRPDQDPTTAKDKLADGDIWHLPAIRRQASQHTGKNIKIAVFDTGIDPHHRELQGKIVESYGFKSSTSQQGQIELSPVAADTDGHGTHVGGLICGNLVGVAPESQLVSVAMLPKGTGSLVNFLVALEWVMQQPDIRIVNISAGIFQYSQPMSDAIDDLLAFGILPICAVGNEGRNKTRSPGNSVGAISVGATNQQNQVASFSGSGTLVVDHHQYKVPSLVAPGAKVYSSVMNGGYEAWDGTSMATPIVSGVAALILEEDPNLTADDLREALLASCQDLGQDSDRQGKGIIQVLASS